MTGIAKPPVAYGPILSLGRLKKAAWRLITKNGLWFATDLAFNYVRYLRSGVMFVKWAIGLPAAGAAMLFVALALCGEPEGEAVSEPVGEETKAATAAPLESARVPVAVARERAELMYRIYAATLEVLHHRYFHDSRATVPARAMEDVFAEIAKQSQVEANWISVNTRAMSLSHEPKSEFEKAAAKEIADGKEQYELVEDGYYRRAGAIPLSSGCVNCHAGFFKAPPKSPRFAALVISVPVTEEAKSE